MKKKRTRGNPRRKMFDLHKEQDDKKISFRDLKGTAKHQTEWLVIDHVFTTLTCFLPTVCLPKTVLDGGGNKRKPDTAKTWRKMLDLCEQQGDKKISYHEVKGRTGQGSNGIIIT